MSNSDRTEVAPEHAIVAPPKSNSPSARNRLVGYGIFCVVLAAAFIVPLVALVRYASGEELHSHIVLIPFISGYLLWLRRKDLPTDHSTSAGWALVPFVAALAALAAAWVLPRQEVALSRNDFLALMAFAFVCLVAVGGFVFLGRKWMAAAAFPFLFLLFFVPLPDRVVHVLENASKLASAEAASWFFTLAGTPFFRDEVFFKLPGITIEVAEECSGIRSSWVLMITSLLASQLFLTQKWRRAALVAFVIPLAVLRNGFRIFTIGLLCVEVGPQMIDHFLHRRGGPVFFAASLVPLFALLWWLRRGDPVRTTGGKAEEARGP